MKWCKHKVEEWNKWIIKLINIKFKQSKSRPQQCSKWIFSYVFSLILVLIEKICHHSRHSTTFPNNSKFIKSTLLHVAFSTFFSAVFNWKCGQIRYLITTYLLSEVKNLQVSDWRSVSCTKWASCNVSSPNRSCKHSKSEIPEKLGNPARLKSLIHSQENLASKRIVPSRSGTFFVLMLCFKSCWEPTRRAISSTWQISPAYRWEHEHLNASIFFKCNSKRFKLVTVIEFHLFCVYYRRNGYL